jgi:hypothetical protein
MSVRTPSTAAIRREQKLRVRRIVRKLEDCTIKVNYIGGIHRARTAGSNIVAFGETPSEARQRLSKLQEMRSVCIPKNIDVTMERTEQRGRA